MTILLDKFNCFIFEWNNNKRQPIFKTALFTSQWTNNPLFHTLPAHLPHVWNCLQLPFHTSKLAVHVPIDVARALRGQRHVLGPQQLLQQQVTRFGSGEAVCSCGDRGCSGRGIPVGLALDGPRAAHQGTLRCFFLGFLFDADKGWVARGWQGSVSGGRSRSYCLPIDCTLLQGVFGGTPRVPQAASARNHLSCAWGGRWGVRRHQGIWGSRLVFLGGSQLLLRTLSQEQRGWSLWF